MTELVDAKTVAAVIGVSARLVQRLARQGRIPSFTVGDRLLRFDLRAVLDALAKSEAR